MFQIEEIKQFHARGVENTISTSSTTLADVKAAMLVELLDVVSSPAR